MISPWREHAGAGVLGMAGPAATTAPAGGVAH